MQNWVPFCAFNIPPTRGEAGMFTTHHRPNALPAPFQLVFCLPLAGLSIPAACDVNSLLLRFWILFILKPPKRLLVGVSAAMGTPSKMPGPVPPPPSPVILLPFLCQLPLAQVAHRPVYAFLFLFFLPKNTPGFSKS